MSNTTAAVAFAWDFGDGTDLSPEPHPAHVYSIPGKYNWRVVSTVSGVSSTNSGTITISDPVVLRAAALPGSVALSWSDTSAPAVLEKSSTVGPAAPWQPVTTNFVANPGTLNVTLSPAENGYFRIRRVW